MPSILSSLTIEYYCKFLYKDIVFLEKKLLTLFYRHNHSSSVFLYCFFTIIVIIIHLILFCTFSVCSVWIIFYGLLILFLHMDYCLDHKLSSYQSIHMVLHSKQESSLIQDIKEPNTGSGFRSML